MNKHISANFKYSSGREQYTSKLTVVYIFFGGEGRLASLLELKLTVIKKNFASVNPYMNFRKTEISLKQLWK